RVDRHAGHCWDCWGGERPSISNINLICNPRSDCALPKDAPPVLVLKSLQLPGGVQMKVQRRNAPVMLFCPRPLEEIESSLRFYSKRLALSKFTVRMFTSKRY